jgi:transposase
MFVVAYAEEVNSDKPPVGKIKYKAVDRSQSSWQVLDYEHLIGPEHPARIIWELAGKMNLDRFAEAYKTREGEAGRPCWSPQLLVSVWVYSYTQRVASARAIERLMREESGLRWLTADQEVNYHTLADFRVGQRAALEKLFVDFLAMLDKAGVVNLKTVLQDGTKMRSVAGRQSMHRRPTLEKRLKEARKVVKKLDREATQEPEGMEKRRLAAQQRAAREAVARGEAALKELETLETRTAPSERANVRVSESEAEARKMKESGGGFPPGYNMQVSTEEQSRMIVSVGLTSDTNDLHQLIPALDRIEESGLPMPQTVIADNGYATRDNVEQTAERNVELVAPWKEDASRQAGACARNGIEEEFAAAAFQPQARGQELACPDGKTLVVIQQKKHHGIQKVVFEAQAQDCQSCRFRAQCCGNRGGPRRVEVPVESKAMRDYLARMKRRAVKKLYKKRCEIAEFPHLWIKGVQQLRRFSVRGIVKAGTEALWMALAYNVTQWIRVRTLLA